MKIFTVLITIVTLRSTWGDYWTDRQQLIGLEESQTVGSSLILNKKEVFVNKYILMSYKTKEYDEGFKNSSVFAPSRHFFQAREEIEKSLLFNFIKKMPKGAALHGHDVSIASDEYIYNLTFRENLYACTVNGRLNLKFLTHPTQSQKCNWTLLSDLRKIDPNYNAYVKSQLTLNVPNPREKYKNLDDIWNIFMNTFSTLFGMVTYRPVFQDYFYESLKELYNDNVMYLEFRGVLPTVYELNGTVYDKMQVAQLYSDVIQRFKSDYPDFVGARFIYGPLREVSDLVMSDYAKTVTTLKSKFPNFFAGFDLVGQEDLGRPLTAFVDNLLEMSAQGIDFFFHAGETNWYGTSSDFNLVDAVLLGTKRIGHGYALTKHPEVMKLVKERQIAIEVCPISNQVLMLVEDLRNHPAASLIAQGFPIVISYDDPSFWSSKGLSYDFYLAFMGLAGKTANLKFLKQIAINSILYSAMPEVEKKLAFKAWEKRWEDFIESIINENRLFYDLYECTLSFPILTDIIINNV